MTWAPDPALWDFGAGLSSDRPRVVLGVDGGSTSTVCVCIPAPDVAYSSQEPPVLGRASAGCSNHNSVGLKASKAALEMVLAGALRRASSSRSAVEAVCLAVSGVDTSSDEERLSSWLRTLFPNTAHIYVYNDAIAALASGTCGRLHGCVLVAGTGTISYGFTADGRKARSSGYGHLLGDQGSGYGIASQALSAVMRAHDGRGPQTELSGAILNHLHLKQADDLIRWMYADTSWARVAALVPVVKACALAGDPVAKAVLDNAVEELALSITAVVRGLELAGRDGLDPFPLVLVGGVLEKDYGDMFTSLVDRVAQSFRGVQAVRPQVEPAVGAAMLAGMQSLPRSHTLCNGSMSPAEV